MKQNKPFDIQTYRTYQTKHNFLYLDILDLTKSIGDTYPGHRKWYMEKFLPDLRDGNRGYIVAKQGNKLVGVVLFKDSEEEKKISTLFINPEFRRQGLATRLLRQAVKELGNDCFLTVSVRNMFQLQPLLKKNGFKVINAVKGKYKPDNIEYYFRYVPKQTRVQIRQRDMER